MVWEQTVCELAPIYRYFSVVLVSKVFSGNFPGGAVVKNLPANAGDTGLSPGPGRSHRPRSN